MQYNKVHADWKNEVEGLTTPILAEDLEHIEEGISQASRSASESQDGNVELASPAEMTLGTSQSLVPAVKTVKDYVAAAISGLGGGTTPVATETNTGTVELATTEEMTAGSDTPAIRVPSVAKVAAYVTTAISTLSASVTASLAGKADKSASLSQFVDVSDATPTDLSVLRYNGGVASYVPAQLTSLYASIDANGRIAESAEPQYYVPMKVINEGESTTGLPSGIVVLSRAAAGSLVPTFIGSAEGGSYASTADTLTFTTTDSVEVGEYVLISIGGGAELTMPIAFTVGYGGGGAAALTWDPIVAGAAGASFAVNAFGRCTTRIPSGATITVQNGGQSNNAYDRAWWMVGMAKTSTAIAQTSPREMGNTTTGLSSSSLTLSLSVGTSTTPNTLAFAVFCSNPGALATNPVAQPFSRTYAPGSGWTALGPYLWFANATTLRGMQMQYRVYSSTGAITATQIVTSDGSGNAAWAAAATVLKGA